MSGNEPEAVQPRVSQLSSEPPLLNDGGTQTSLHGLCSILLNEQPSTALEKDHCRLWLFV